jgi:preprotein translocase subunit SecA
MCKIDDEVIRTFETAEITEQGTCLGEGDLTGPGATWTYLVNDNPFGGWLERAFKGIQEKLKSEID